MRKLLLALAFIFMFAGSAFADTITIDSSGWTQEQKNMTTAIAVKILYDNGITADKIIVNLPTIEVVSPSKTVSVLTKEKIESEFVIWKTANESAIATVRAEEAAKETEIANSTLAKVTLSQVDTAVDNVSNLAEAKVFLKKLTRYIKAKGL
jgi:hypothetical protein